MRTRSIGLSLLASAAIIVSACGGATPAPSQGVMSEAPATQAPGSAAPSAAPQSNLKIGVVTDVGTINDKNFNEYSYKGAQDGATAIGVQGTVPYAVPKDASEYAKLIQNFVDQKFDIIVTVGFALTAATETAAKANPNIWFVGVDQGNDICVDATGAVDTAKSPQCAGNANIGTLLPHYIPMIYKEDQAGYLAGIIAASVSKSGNVGAIGGITLCGPCVKYIQGFELGAKSVSPNIKVTTTYITTSDFKKAFADQATGKAFGQQFILQTHVDVLFQVAGLTGNGILDAACAAGIYGIGVDSDQWVAYPTDAKCILTSAEKHLQTSVAGEIQAIAAGTAKAGLATFDATNDGIGYAPGHDLASVWPSDPQSKIDAAVAAMKAGTLTTCPTNCGKAG
ncbi:MAG TPA: BMP family ABC transporter substrate-binding protein [Candidatus Binatus sp.]|nr:BMP family ABC transporter substrate-binding protein [Candidatus Binatus sp.]